MSITEKCGVLLCLCLLLRVVCPDGEAIGRPLCPTDPEVQCRPDKSSGLREYAYSVEGARVIMEFAPGGYFSVQCDGNVTLDSRSMPRLSVAHSVSTVSTVGCILPPSSLADALARLNVTVLTKLALYDATVAGGLPLRRAHLADLPNLADLVVTASAGPEPEAGFLEELRALRGLRLEGLRLRPGELERLPARLESLHLVRLGEGRVSGAALARLPLLRVLTVRDVIKVEIELGGGAGGSLETLTLDAPGAAVPGGEGAAGLRSVTVWRWGEAAPAPWRARLCERLEELQVVLPAARSLPPGWLSGCKRLSALLVSHARFVDNTVPEGLLRGATGLLEFNMTSCRLRSLPPKLFNETLELQNINLSNNELTTLWSNQFYANVKLVRLELSHNKLSAAALEAVSWMHELRSLSFADNPIRHFSGEESDIILTRGLSKLSALKALERLSLSDTGATRVHQDWRENMLNLVHLDLSNNNITDLLRDDLQFKRNVHGAVVDLTGNRISSIKYEYQEYDSVRSGVGLTAHLLKATVLVDSLLKCDCNVYWTARAFREKSSHVDVRELRCAPPERDPGAGPTPLVSAPLERMSCPAGDGSGGWCPAGCRCWNRPRDPAEPSLPPHTPHTPRSVLRVECTGAGLSAPPPLPRVLGAGWEMVLRNNSIADVSRKDLPDDLLELDLRDNLVHDPSALLADPAPRLLLANNPLQCTCERALPAELLRARARLDYPHLTCAEPAGPLAAAPSAAECARRARLRLGLALAGALVPLALAAAALGAWLLRPELRLRVKATLAARGWLPRRDEAADGRRYDAFVSHSHLDEAAAREVVARLERAGYRVCVHWRDWAPGEWIPAQIAASVSASRRTVALVSEHFVRSRWARAEFREAHAAALRSAHPSLVAVLLGRPARELLAAHPALATFLDSNTYVEWGDPWFWEKLAYAMPRLPRARRGAPLTDPLPPAPEVAAEAAPPGPTSAAA